MSSYVVLARKWRPQSFATLVGQGHVTRALINALESGRIPHAFLFTGIRGVGKTTIARLLARCLNCDRGVGPEPCGQCEACQAIINGNHPDVMEIDAASRTKVDQMREVLDMVRYAPTSAPYKVYVLDEVHMLTTQSFNALLKTLEEPPAHVKFIFATTDSHKIPATILSRCQRYDLKRLDRETLTNHLAHVLDQEGIPHDPEGLAAVARAADGSVRDGLSLLDQVIAHGDGAVRYEAVRELLGLTGREAVAGLLGALLRGEAAAILSGVQGFHQAGVEPAALVGELLEGLHAMARFKVLGEDESQDPHLQQLAGLAAERAMEHLQMAYQVLLRGLADLKLAESPVQALEMLLLRVAFLRPVPALETLLKGLPRDSGGGGTGGSAATGNAGGWTPPLGQAQGGGSGARNGQTAEDVGTPLLPPAPSRAAPGTPPPALSRGHLPGGHAPLPEAGPTPLPPRPPECPADSGNSPLPAVENPRQGGPFASWDQLISFALQHAPGLGSKLAHRVACQSWARDPRGQLLLTVQQAGEVADPPALLRDKLLQQLHLWGENAPRVTVLPPHRGERPETHGERQRREARQQRELLLESARAHPVVRALMERFDAEIIDVRPREEADSGGALDTLPDSDGTGITP